MNMTPYFAELFGTFMLLLLGVGINANCSLKATAAEKQHNWILISSGWGLAVFVSVFILGQFSGAHLNPAVTLGLAVAGKFSWQLVPGYIGTQLIGAFLGAYTAFFSYRDHYNATTEEATVRSTFCTGPLIRNYKNNFITELIGTFVLVFCALSIVNPSIAIEGMEVENFGLGALEALPIGLVVWVIGIALGGATGYAINPARDLGPRLVYQSLARKNKDADWAYSWVPIFGPFVGGSIAGGLYLFLA